MFSFLVGTHNEGREYIKKCTQCILDAMIDDDELIIVDDFSTDESTLQILSELKNNPNVKILKHALDGDFSKHKNFFIEHATKDYIFLFDADEFMLPENINRIRTIVNSNSKYDSFYVPEANIVEDITQEYANKMKWNLSTVYGITMINYPDAHIRIWKNHLNIKYINKIHEVLTGYNQVAWIPLMQGLEIIHMKSFERQKKQNELYKQLDTEYYLKQGIIF